MEGISWRDRAAWAVCNFMLRHVATPWYRRTLDAALRRGLLEGAMDALSLREMLGPGAPVD